MKNMEQEKKTAMRVSAVTIAWNVILSIFKLIAGVVGHSGAMISDAVHSASDVFSTIIVILGINIASRQSDDDHQYGHDRLECVAAILLAVVLFATGIGIGIGGINKIIEGTAGKDEIPGMIALIAAVASIVVKEGMFWYTRSAAKKINSGALMADAWHHRSDALSSVGALIGIGGARLGFPVLDPIASVIICVFIVKAAYDIFKDAIDKMVDKSCDEETEEKMRRLIEEQQGVLKVDVLRTRLFGAKMYVDIEIAADGDITLREGHEIAQVVHDKVEEEFPLVKHCMVHVNPL
jgi:cation diffusion facilitator family transporter